jgi:diguanylate cyclase (GGDEF)-like protein/PAS domain S-box-containing protein
MMQPAFVVTVATLYVLTGKLGFLVAMPPGNVTAVWAPSGIALAAVLLLGYRIWPGIWLGSFWVNTWFFTSFFHFSAEGVATSASIAVGSTLQALLGAYLIRRFIGAGSPMDRAPDIFKFTGIEMASCLVAATFGVTSLGLGGFTPWADYLYTWLTWWLGDLVGIMIVAPLLLSWYRISWISRKPRQLVEALFLLVLLGVDGQIVFGDSLYAGSAQHLLAYTLIPLVAWVAFRFEQSGVTLATLIVSGIAIWGTAQGFGPYARETLNESLLLLQAFLGVVALTGLILAAAVSERKRSEEALRQSGRRFQAVIENSWDAIVLVGADGTLLYTSPSNPRVLGYTGDELAGRKLFELVHPDDRAYAQDQMAELLRGPGMTATVECRVWHKDGSWRWVESTGTNLLDEPSVQAMVINYRDITERKQSEQSLQRYAERLKTLHEIDRAILELQSPSAIAETVLGRIQQLVACYRASVVLFDLKAHEALVLAASSRGTTQVGTGTQLPMEAFDFGSIEQLGLGNIHYVPDILTLPHLPPVIQKLKAEGIRSYVNAPMISQGKLIGSLNLGADRPNAFSQEDIEIVREAAVLLAVAIQQARLYEEVQGHAVKLEYQAMYDPLTGIPNRLLLHDRLQQAIRAGQRENKPVALLILDLDHFKAVNDTLGHPFGDSLLQQIGPRLQSALRESDTLARLAGDEFVILLPNTEAKGAVLLANKVMEALEEPFRVEGETVHISTSIGIALFPEHGGDAETLMRHADVAMYLAKESRGRYAIYASEQDPYSPTRLARADELRRTIDEGDRLVLLYQPKVSMRSGRVFGVEAFVRWHHPQHGLIPPAQFFPLAEQIGHIKPLTSLLLKKVLYQCQTWHRAGLEIPVAMNVPTRNLQDPQFPDQVSELLENYHVAPNGLELEITEKGVLDDPERAVEALMRLSRMGVRLCIDDFGTGYSSLGLLKKLPLEAIKIDKSFVIGMAQNENDAVIVRSAIALGHNLGLQVVAEGVESHETWNQLAALGCDAAQGYYISQPIEAEELPRWLRESPWGLKRSP